MIEKSARAVSKQHQHLLVAQPAKSRDDEPQKIGVRGIERLALNLFAQPSMQKAADRSDMIGQRRTTAQHLGELATGCARHRADRAESCEESFRLFGRVFTA